MKEESSCFPTTRDYIKTEVQLSETTLIRLQSGTVSEFTLEGSMPDLISGIYLTFLLYYKAKILSTKEDLSVFPSLIGGIY